MKTKEGRKVRYKAQLKEVKRIVDHSGLIDGREEFLYFYVEYGESPSYIVPEGYEFLTTNFEFCGSTHVYKLISM